MVRSTHLRGQDPRYKTRHTMTMLTAALIIVFAAWAHFSQFRSLSGIELKIYDQFLSSRPEPELHDQPVLEPPVLVTIDEHSLRQLGQWPWPRYRIAKLLEMIAQSEPAAVGLDLIFSEPDQTSLHIIRKNLREELGRDVTFSDPSDASGLSIGLFDNDKILANVLNRGPFVLGYGFRQQIEPDHVPDDRADNPCLPHSLHVAYLDRASLGSPIFTLSENTNITCNYNVLQKAGAGGGFINATIDADGILRRLPLVLQYRGKVYPSLSLATLMHATGERQITYIKDSTGNENIRIGRLSIPLDKGGFFRINFRKQSVFFKHVSAADIIAGQIDPEIFKNKIIYIGVTAQGIRDFFTTSVGSMIPGLVNHANVTDGVLKQDFITRPSWGRLLELVLIVFCGIIMIIATIFLPPVWAVVFTSILLAVLWGGGRWALHAHGLFFSPLFPVFTVVAVFVVTMMIRYIALRKLSLKIWREKNVAEETERYKSQFLANMSHEIRTPMNAVIGMSYLVKKTGLTKRQTEYLNKIELASKNLLGIINDVLDYSKINAGKLELESIKFNLSEVITSVSSIVWVQAEEKGNEILFNVKPEVPKYLVGDPLRLSQVLINLIANAVRFTENGVITLTIEVSGRRKEDIAIDFHIKDTGMGMTEDQRNHIFDSFSQAESSVRLKLKGVGLGLAISRNLVKLMGGDITVESQPNHGSRFSFTGRFGLIPDAEPLIPELPRNIRESRLLFFSRRKADRAFLTSFIHHCGFSSCEIVTGQNDMSRVKKRMASGPPYRLILNDLIPANDNFSRMIQIVEQQKRVNKDLKIVQIISPLEDIDNQTTRRIDPDAVLYKPVNPMNLTSAVKEAFYPDRTFRENKAGGETTPSDKEPSGKRFNGTTVLVAEDDKVSQIVAKGLLARIGFNVTVVDNGRDALNAVLQNHYDLVFLDIDMPVLDGYQVAERINDRLGEKRPPIIAMTAHALPGDREKSLDAGMDDHITKPLEPEKIHLLMREWIDAKPEQISII